MYCLFCKDITLTLKGYNYSEVKQSKGIYHPELFTTYECPYCRTIVETEERVKVTVFSSSGLKH